jgi:hypothetical protein
LSAAARAAQLEIGRCDQARQERALCEFETLSVLWEVAYAELVEQQSEVTLYPFDTEEDLIGNLLIGRGRCEPVGRLEWAAKRD